jgi:hypothetical protein
MSKKEMVERLHWLAKKRFCLFRGMRMKRMMMRMQAMEMGPCHCCKK